MTVRQCCLIYLIGFAVSLSSFSASTMAADSLESRYGVSAPRDRIASADSPEGAFYLDQVQPILERRCVVCHACYDSPCQLNLSAPEGIDRGANSDKVYKGSRRSSAPLTRLIEDAKTTAQWRAMDFYPVLNEYQQSPTADLEASVLHHMLALKRDNPLPPAPILDRSFDLKLNRDQQCPKLSEIDKFKAKKPLWGMPYALPGVTDAEHQTLTRWLEAGANMARPAPADPQIQARVERWERFLNGDSLKQQLMSRYLYEHWFLAHLHFDELGESGFFRIMRSSTPPGQPIAIIPSRRPYDDPGVERVYYRLWRDHSTVVDKTHMPYALNAARMSWLRDLFLEPDYQITALPSYEPEVAANPFVAYSAIPAESRWQFLLAEAQFTVMNFIKGPVCRGQTALNVIRDHFWVFFASPDFELKAEATEFLRQQEINLRMPVEAGSSPSPLSTWKKYSKSQEAYLQAKSEALEKYFPGGSFDTGQTLELLWDGDGDNQNAALTVFRHFDSASVVRGLVGPRPMTAWVIDYPILERIHYLLVAGYDVYGAAGHQLTTRLYMDFLRLEGEFNFLALLPPETRLQERELWYRGASKKQQSYLFGSRAEFDQPSGISYQTDEPKQELFGMLEKKLEPSLNRAYDLDQPSVPASHRSLLQSLMTVRGTAASLLPQVTFLNVQGRNGQEYYYTVLHNTAHSNVTSLFKESKNLIPEEDTVSVVANFIGSYPDAYWRVKEAELPMLVVKVQGLKDETSYRKLVDRYGVRRTSPDFWAFSDRMVDAHHAANPLENGLLDYNRLENR